jgi:hypothetical protein
MEKSYRDAKIRNGVSAEVYGLYHKKEVVCLYLIKGFYTKAH